jgi:hypothetical protein
MDEIEIIIKALKAEALSKPSEKIIAGFESFTYKEFAEMLDKKKLQSNQIVDAFLNSALKMFKENSSYKQKMLELAGIKERI